ncbi:MAG TPA: histidine phosphatase family protein [Acidobacteria bacterium]|nr:histidine phosphatase family protein [Acidobacteriota bacterium]
MNLSYNTAHRTVPLFYLIRHAETDLNVSRTIQWPHTPLNTQGQWQANRLAAALRDKHIGRIISSDYLRARETAECLSHGTTAPISIDIRLRERHFGTLRGESWPLSWKQFDSDDFEPPGGESQPNFQNRVKAAWESLEHHISQAEHSIAIVTHGLVCRTVAQNNLTWSEQSEPPRFSNTSITVIGGAAPWNVIEGPTNDHLKENYQYATLCTHCP